METTSRALQAGPGFCPALLFMALVMMISFQACALERNVPLLALPKNIPPSLLRFLESTPIFNMHSSKISYLPGVRGISRAKFIQRLPPGFPTSTINKFLFFSEPVTTPMPDTLESLCDCRVLAPQEFVVSEIPVKNTQGHFVSINDESHKALLELAHYPLDTPRLTAVALSELVYTYNADVIDDHLKRRGFTLLMDRGFMNSSDYPGYRDSQYFAAQSATHLYLVVRGTSGAADLQVTLDADPVPFLGLGLAHRGYLDIAEYIYKDFAPLVASTQLPVILTGHSMGGAVSLLLTLMLTNAGHEVTNYNFSPVPPTDKKIVEHFDGLVSIHNYFQPTDELTELEERSNWLRLPGTRITAPEVGLTAGRAHYVINYLKSMLVIHGRSQMDYEAGLPDCVVSKYPCFDADPVRLVSRCALIDDHCFLAQADFLLGYQLSRSVDTLPAPTHAPLPSFIIESTKRLLAAPPNSHESTVLTLRLAYLHLINHDKQRTRNLLASQPFDSDAGFIGFLKKIVSLKATGSPEAIRALK